MPISRMDLTNTTIMCPVDFTQQTVLTNSLVAGTDGSSEMIQIPACVNGHVEYLIRCPEGNPFEQSGFITGVHRRMVQLSIEGDPARTNAIWRAQLEAEAAPLYQVPLAVTTQIALVQLTNSFSSMT